MHTALLPGLRSLDTRAASRVVVQLLDSERADVDEGSSEKERCLGPEQECTKIAVKKS